MDIIKYKLYKENIIILYLISLHTIKMVMSTRKSNATRDPREYI